MGWLDHRPAAEEFHDELVSSLRAGDTIDIVQHKLGESKPVAWDDVPGWVTNIQQREQYYPDGMQTTDKFLHYSVADANGNNEEWYFQFRDDRLINFDPAELGTYAESRAQIVGLSQ